MWLTSEPLCCGGIIDQSQLLGWKWATSLGGNGALWKKEINFFYPWEHYLAHWNSNLTNGAIVAQVNAAGFCEAASCRKTIEKNILVFFFFSSFNIRTTLGLFILESSHNEKKELGFGNLRLTQSRISPIQTTFLQKNAAAKLCAC